LYPGIHGLSIVIAKILILQRSLVRLEKMDNIPEQDQ